MTNINVNFANILTVDTEETQTCWVEPSVTIGQITKRLTPLGWTLPIVPELDDLTIGGLVMGCGIESSSHVHGLFHNICVEYELCLSDGAVVTCSKDNDPELFDALPWSHGTLGFLTAVKHKIVPAKKYVRIEYEPVHGLDNLIRTFEFESKNVENTFVEGLVYSGETGVIMTGRFVKDSSSVLDDGQINEIGKWYKPWFFIHVRNILKVGMKKVEYIPLRDYYHRHSRSIFWELQDIIPFGNHPIFRYTLGWLMPIKVSLLKLTQTPPIKRLYEENHFIQDFLVPVSHLKKSLELFDSMLNLYPIWLCPLRLPAHRGLVHPRTNETAADLYVDIGLYGLPQADGFRPAEATAKIEQFVIEHNGFQMLYADTYLSRQDFKRMFDHTHYDVMRDKLDCHRAFPEIYDKINKNVRS